MFTPDSKLAKARWVPLGRFPHMCSSNIHIHPPYICTTFLDLPRHIFGSFSPSPLANCTMSHRPGTRRKDMSDEEREQVSLRPRMYAFTNGCVHAFIRHRFAIPIHPNKCPQLHNPFPPCYNRDISSSKRAQHACIHNAVTKKESQLGTAP